MAALSNSRLIMRSLQIDAVRALLLLSVIGIVVLSVGLLLALARPEAQLALLGLSFGSAAVPTFLLLLDVSRRAHVNVTVLHALGFRPARLTVLVGARVAAVAVAGAGLGVACVLSLLLASQFAGTVVPVLAPTSPAFLILLGYVAAACVVGACVGAGLGARRAWKAFS